MKTRFSIIVLLAILLADTSALAAANKGKTQPNAAKTNASNNSAPAQDMPTSFSLRPDYIKLGLDVRDQGNRGSCTLFGILGSLEYEYSKAAGKAVPLSEQFAGWAADKIAVRTKNSDYKFGDVVNGIKQYGVCSESLMPYQISYIGLSPSQNAMTDAMKRTSIQASYIVPDPKTHKLGFTQDQLMTICGIIAQGQPVTFSLHLSRPVLDNNYTIQASQNNPGNNDFHVMVMIGYDLGNRWPGGGRIEVRNEWGKSWGQNGYAWVSFDYLEKYADAALILRLTSNKQ